MSDTVDLPGAPSAIDLDALSRLGEALRDATRRRLLVALARGPAYPAELAVELGESRSNVSNHLGCLRGCGLIVAAPEGRRMRYELADERLGHALRALVELVLSIDPRHEHLPAGQA